MREEVKGQTLNPKPETYTGALKPVTPRSENPNLTHNAQGFRV